MLNAPDADGDAAGQGASAARTLRLPGFAVVSGIGWILDFAVFTSLVLAGAPLFTANLLGATCGVSFVFVTGRRFIFRNLRTSLRTAVLSYALWNVAAILLMSLMIAALGRLLAGPAVAGPAQGLMDTLGVGVGVAALAGPASKIALTPLSMYLNFVAMGFIIERRLHLF